jgi:Zn-dependent M28 family amino/carboxypeptidase/nicotinamidase-related amidase
MRAFLTLGLFFSLVQAPHPSLPAPFTAENFRAHVAYLASDELGGREVGSEGETKAIDYIIQRLKETGAIGLGPDAGYIQSFSFVFTPPSQSDKPPATRELQGRNVLAIVRGKAELAKEAIVVSCHHDHLGMDPELLKAGKDGIYNGADDNASGCAALLLMAEALHEDRDRLPNSCRSVIFASFDAEEKGLVGSRYYLNHPPWPLERTAADINFDMVGRLNGQRLLAADSQSNSYLEERIRDLAAESGLRVETQLNGHQRADHQNFLDRAIPAAHFSSGLHADYHQVSDEVARIDAEGGARIAWLAYRVLRDTMAAPGKLRYRQPPPAFNVAAILKVMFRLGIIPEQGAQSGKSALVRYVIPGSFAAKQDLRPGDEITGMNGKNFESVIDAALAFSRLDLNQDLKLAIVRAGNRQEVVIPASFLREAVSQAAAPDTDGSRSLKFVLRDRKALAENGDQFEVRERTEGWDPKQTAIIICDMWDLHHCKRAVDRVKEMAPRMNEVIARARDRGVLIIHAPSECMAAYENTPMRERARNAPPAKNLPRDIAAWCDRIPAEEKGRYPIDQSDGGEDDESAEHSQWAAHLTSLGRNPKAPWKREIDVLQMKDSDAISDSGVEIWSLLEARGIKNVILMGVHTNMCVLGRPFGLRQMAKNGKHVVLMRDLTDTMYNPARWPHVSHFEGTERIIEHIEKFVCPTISSDQILGGKPFRFKNDDRTAAAP